MLLLKHRLYESKIFTIYSKIVSELKKEVSNLISSLHKHYMMSYTISNDCYYDDLQYNKCYFTLLGSKRYVTYAVRKRENTIITAHHIALLYGHVEILKYLDKIYSPGLFWDRLIYSYVIQEGLYEKIKLFSKELTRDIRLLLDNEKYMYLINYVMLQRTTDGYYSKCKNIKLKNWIKKFYSQ